MPSIQDLAKQKGVTLKPLNQMNNAGGITLQELAKRKGIELKPVVEEKPKTFLQKTGEVIKGAGKGLLSTLSGASAIGENMLKTTGRIITPKSLEKTFGFQKEDLSSAKNLQNKIENNLGIQTGSLTTPINNLQKIGFTLEQIAEFFVPGGASLKAGKAAETAVVGGKLLKGITKFGATGLTEAGITTGLASLQKGKIDKETVEQGLISGAVFPGLGALSKFGEKVGTSLWGSVLNRTKAMVEKSPKLEQQVSQLGLFGTKKMIAKKAATEIQSLETQLDDLITPSIGKISSSTVASKLDDLEELYKQIPGEEGSITMIKNLKNEMIKKGEMTVTEAQKLKRSIYKIIKKSYGKGTLEIPAKIESQKLLAMGLKEEIERIIPEAKKLNEKQAIFLQVKKALDKELARPRKGIAGTGIGLYDLALVGAGYGISGGDFEKTAGLLALKKGAESTILRTGTAAMIKYFNGLSPTKKMMFYNALKGLLIETPKLSGNKPKEE